MDKSQIMKFSIDVKKLQTIAVVLLAFAFSIAMVTYVANHPETVEAFIRQVGVWGPLVSVVLYAILGVSPIPSEALSMINGAVFGPLLGTLVGFVGNMIAALIEYWIGASLGNVADFEERKEHLPFGLGRLPVNSIWFLLFARMVPGYGGKLVSVIGGVYRVPLWRYIWTAAIPTFVGTALFVMGGFGLMNVF
jgi:uncharacterized membrane protein YdjX (TVP38/TMEM64 family)